MLCRRLVIVVLGLTLFSPRIIRAEDSQPASSRGQASGVDDVPLTPEIVTISHADPAPAADDPNAPAFYIGFHGEYEMRGNGMNTIPLRALPSEPATGSLGQNRWVDGWLRLRLELGVRPYLRVVAQMDVAKGEFFGDRAYGIEEAALRRDSYVGFGSQGACANELQCDRTTSGLMLRYLYLEWASNTSPAVFRIGQMGFYWGLGLVANDGDHAPFFGDYHYGSIVDRILFATKPFGRESPLTLAVAGDLVNNDLTAILGRGDHAYQGVLSALYEKESLHAGIFGAYRYQTDLLLDRLNIGILDVFARKEFSDPAGGKLYAAFEGALFVGKNSLARTVTQPDSRVLQGLFAVDLGRVSEKLDVMLEAGYTTGDSNSEDGVDRRATMSGDHVIGLIMFPEIVAWETARAIAYASSPNLAGVAPRGAWLYPSNGGVAGAMYLFPRVSWRITPWLEARVGAVLGRTTSPFVDLVQQQLSSVSVNYRGGSPSARDLGLELDASVTAKHALSRYVTLVGGLEGGVLFPGTAFNDATGTSMGNIGLVRLRAGLRW